MKPPQWLMDVLPQAGRDFLDAGGWYLVLAVAGVLVLVVVGLVLRSLSKMFGRKAPAPEANLRENLADYPPAPGKPGPRRLLVQGIAARLRLVVIAPMGKQATVTAEQAEGLLDHALRGLGSVCQHDRPRVRIWPPQLSVEGFGHQFHRYTTKPEREGQPSSWALAAGKARVGQSYILLGLALQTDEENTLPPMMLKPEQWNEVLRIKA